MPLVPLSILHYYWFLEVKYFWWILNPCLNRHLPLVGKVLTAGCDMTGSSSSESIQLLNFVLGVGIKLCVTAGVSDDMSDWAYRQHLVHLRLPSYCHKPVTPHPPGLEWR